MNHQDSQFSTTVEDYIRCHLVRGGINGRETGLAWFLTGAPVPELNQILRVSMDTFEKAQAIGAGEFTLWNVWPGITPPEVEAAILSAGLTFVEEEAVMTRPVDSKPSPLPMVEGVTIRELTSKDALYEWVGAWQPRMHSEARREVVEVLGTAGLGKETSQRYLVAEDGAHVIGCALIVLGKGGCAALEHVATRKAHRNRGIGTLLTHAGIQFARDSGAQRIMLTASHEGRRIYERAGFVEVGRVRRFGQGSPMQQSAARKPSVNAKHHGPV